MPTEMEQTEPASPADDGSIGTQPLVDPAQESLGQALRTGFNLLRVFMIVLLVAYFFSGWFQVASGEQGLIVRFGHLLENAARDPAEGGTAVFEPGFHASLPDPFDEKIRISGQIVTTEVDSFLFQRQAGDFEKNIEEIQRVYDSLDPKVHGSMITGDRNLAHGLWTVSYHIKDAEKFVRSVTEDVDAFGPFLQRLLENAVVRTVARLPLERVTVRRTSEEATDLTVAVKARLERDLARFDTGVAVDTVQADTISPGSVRDAFLDVTRARAEKDREITRARQRRVEILSQTAGTEQRYSTLLRRIDEYGAAQAVGADEARLEELRARIDAELDQAGGEVASVLGQAQSQASAIRQLAALELRQFTDYYEQFREHPREVAMQLWSEMRERILSSKKNELFFVPRVGVIEILTNRDERRAIELEKEALKKR